MKKKSKNIFQDILQKSKNIIKHTHSKLNQYQCNKKNLINKNKKETMIEILFKQIYKIKELVVPIVAFLLVKLLILLE